MSVASSAPIGRPPARPFATAIASGRTARSSWQEPGAAAADARLHLVVDEQRAVAVAELAREREALGVDRPDAALALDRLDEHGAGVRADRGRERGEVVARHVLEAGGHGLERLALRGRPAGCERRERAAVERALDADDAVLGRAAARAPVRRASLIAASTASAPELQKKARSWPESAHRRSASATIGSL